MKFYIPPVMERIDLLQTDVLTASGGGGSLKDLFKPEGTEIDKITWKSM